MKKILLISLTIFYIAHLHAQHVCLDMNVTTGNNGAQNGVYDDNSRWTNGQQIFIKFIGGSNYVRSKIIAFSKEWENYANISFAFDQTAAKPDVIIAFDPSGGSWSYVGTNAKYYTSKNEPSMNFGWFNDNTTNDDFKETTLHEFGHLLGLMHEHQNPLGTIHWNVPYVHNWCATHMGWSIEKTDEQIINKYSVTLTNHKYDRLSIMHYWVDPEWTMDNVGITANKMLSEEDKQLIGEMYPFEAKPPVSSPETKITSSDEKVVVTHNIVRDGVAGMVIKTSFTIVNALGKKCRLSAYFYNNDGDALKDKNNSYHTTDGNVSTGEDFVPGYSNTRYDSLELFMPYNELELPNGEYKLKFNLTIWDDKLSDVFNSGAYYFNYHKGIIVEKFTATHAADDKGQQYTVTPKFVIKYAQNKDLYLYLFMYDQQTGAQVKDKTNQHSTTGGNLYYSHKITPGFENTSYNFSSDDVTITIPYADLFTCLGDGKHPLKYFISLKDVDGNEIAQTDWDYLSITF